MDKASDPNVTADIPSSPADSLDAGLAAGFGRPAVAPRSSLGDLRPVLLKEAEGESGLVVKPRSDAMPSPAEAGDRYQLSGEIARGGMGAVLRGRDVDLGRDLAVKVLLEKYVDRPEVARRFIEEAQIGGQLQHPGVVPVYDFGHFGDRPFFTMKLVKGNTLAALLEERTEPATDRPRFLGIAQHVANTLAYAHAKGVVHRDLKPANVMVGAFGEVQVMDWGLAKVLAEGGIADEERASRQRPEDVTTIRTTRGTGSTGSFGTDTEAGSLLGTPAYMPPEQANGDVAHLDRRADVFGLGAILCEILTGKPPYVGRSAEEVRRKACNGDLADAITRLDTCGADQELITLTKACLSPEAVDRPKDARAVADGLTAYLNGVQERLHQAELAEAAAKAKAAEEAKRRRLTLALAATVLLSLTLGGGAWLWWKTDRDAQRARVTGDVNEALNQAASLRERAKGANLGSAALFAQAREQVQRALAMVSAGPFSDTLKAQVQRLKDELDEEEKDRTLIAVLDEARLAQAETLSENRFADERAVPKFREAFAAYGLPAGQGAPAAAAAWIRQRPAAVREAIVAALDEWDALAGDPKYNVTEPHREWLRAVLATAEPAEGWTRRFQAARDENDEAKRKTALEKLAAADDLGMLPVRALTRLAKQLEKVEAYASAARLLRRAHLQYPADFWVNHQLGWVLEAVSPPERDEALRFMTAAVALRPGSPGARLNLGVALSGKGQLDEAIACYQKALELDPKYAAAHNNLGSVLYAKSDFDGAIACFKTAIELDPKYAAAHSNLGNALHLKGQVDEAIAFHHKALELDPKYARAHCSLGLALFAKDQVDEAIACLKTAIELDPKLAHAHSHLGEVLRRKGEVDEAIASTRTAIELDPKNASAHVKLGLALHDKGQLEEAIASWRKAIELDPKYVVAHNNLGSALARKGQVDEAIACYRKAIELDPKDAGAHCNLGHALKDKGQWDGAITCFRTAIELDPNHAAAHYDLGTVLCDVRGDYDAAIASFRKAIELDPKSAAAYSSLGVALRGKGRVDEAISSYQQALELDPKHALTHSNLGAALHVKGQLDGAISSYRKAIALNPKLATAHHNLGLALARKGQRDQAIASYRQAIALDPKEAEAHNNLGIALLGTGQVDEALASHRQAIALDPKFANGHYWLGNALHAKGQLDEAIASYREAIALDPKHADAHCNQGQALAKLGRFAESLAAYQRGHELGTKQSGWNYPSAQWVNRAERLAALEGKLPAFLKGEYQPRDTAEGLALGGVCHAKKLHHTAARLYADAFAADAKLADDLKTGHRYNAGRCAALAAAGQREVAAEFDDAEKARLRQQALDWLRADLALWSNQLERGKPADRVAVQTALKHWQQDSDLASLRDAATLATLPAEERAACEKLWADVAALLKKAETPAKEEKP